MILHVDMDAFFAAVEQLGDPRLAGRPVLVCGDTEERSVVAAASYEARPYGVRAGMPAREAKRRCPHAVFVPGNPGKYVSLSLGILELLKRFTPHVEPMSIDEAFLDLAGTPHDGEAAMSAAARLQDEVESGFRLTCSVGIGPNKLIAKMASRVRKPRGLTRLDAAGYRELFGPRPVGDLWGVGERTAAVLAPYGIRTVGELAEADPGLLARLFGVNGPRLRRAARGEIDTPVIPYFQGVENRSMGHEHTLARDLSDFPSIEALLLALSDRVTRRMRLEGYVGRTVVLKLRDARFATCMRQRALAEHTDEPRTVQATARRLLRENWNGAPLRLLGVSVSELARVDAWEPSRLFAADRLYRKMIECSDTVRNRFGEVALVPAATLG